jgi:TolB-like protein/Flp pilus assembly protein TadD
MQTEIELAYEFGPFHFYPAESLLLRDGEPVPITMKVLELLLILIRNRGRLVEKERLLKEMWPDSFVAENNLTVNISALRKALGDRGPAHEYIETVPKRGYRFIAGVREVKEPDPAASSRAQPTSRALRAARGEQQVDSLAVLPLANISGDPSTEYLSDGITESIIDGLSKVPRLRVMAHGTVFRYKGQHLDPQEVGHKLGVRAIVMGRVMHLADRLTISTELIDVADGSQLWGRQYNYAMADIFQAQEQIARQILDQLLIKLTGEEEARLGKRYTQNTEAYKLYLKGRYFWNKRTAEYLKKAIEYFQRAIDLDANYALAYAGLADCYSLFGTAAVLRPREQLRKAKEAATRALEIDGQLAEAFASLALARMNYDWDWEAAEKDYRRAIELNPNYATAHHWYGRLLSKLGKLDEAMVELTRAQELDPLSLIISTNVARNFYYAGEYEHAIKLCLEALELDPRFAAAQAVMGLSYHQMGMIEEAIKIYRVIIEVSSGDPEAIAFLGNAYAMQGNTDEALKVLAELEELSRHRYVSPFAMAVLYTGLCDKDSAFMWLDRAYDERSDALSCIKVEPFLNSLRSDPRMTDLLRRTNFIT